MQKDKSNKPNKLPKIDRGDAICIHFTSCFSPTIVCCLTFAQFSCVNKFIITFHFEPKIAKLEI